MMSEENFKYCKESKVVKTSRVFPLDTNNHQTLFGGKLMSYIDDIASISAERYSLISKNNLPLAFNNCLPNSAMVR